MAQSFVYLGTPLARALPPTRCRGHSPPLVRLVLGRVAVAYLVRGVVEGGGEHGVLVCFLVCVRGKYWNKVG